MALVSDLKETTSSTLKIGAGTLTVPANASVSNTNTGDNATNSQYSGLVTNATHTGDVTGATALTIANKVTMTATSPITVSGTPTVIAGSAVAFAISAATASVNGYATAAQITKLDGIASSATANAKASAAEVLAGTNDTKFVTPLGITPILPNRNVIINGGFTVNQRVYVSAAALAAGVYGHDRWKGGSGGGTYSFTQLASPTTITIAANKTLIQVIEDKNVFNTTYTLSWTGTAQGRYAVNSATPGGDYAASPITITGQTVGTVMSVEFNAGTLGKVQLEASAVATPFEFRPFAQELALCQRYYEKSYNLADAPASNTSSGMIGTIAYATSACLIHPWKISKRTAPAVALYSKLGTAAKISLSDFATDVGTAVTAGITGENTHGYMTDSGSGFTAGTGYTYHYTASADL